jgi:putative tricarboxylic transport membrane protein
MGPGFMPVLISSVAIFLGAVKIFQGLRQSGERWGTIRLRPTLFTCAGVLAFAYAMEPLGLPLAIVLLVLVSSLGSRETNWLHTVTLAVILAAGCVALFAYALGIPFVVFPT